MKHALHYRLLKIFMLTCLTLVCATFIFQCFRTGRAVAAYSQLPAQSRANQDFVVELQNQIFILDDAIRRAARTDGDWEITQNELQAAFDQLASMREELAAQFDNLNIFEELDTDLSSLIQRRAAFLDCVDNQTNISADTYSDYNEDAINCINSITTLEEQIVHVETANLEAANYAYSIEIVQLVKAMFLFLVTLIGCFLIIWKVRHPPLVKSNKGQKEF